MKLFKKIDDKTLINLFLIVFAISTFLDLHIFYNSISTLIRSIIITIFFSYILLTRKNYSDIKKFILYGIVLLVYLLFHHINALYFKSLIPGNFNYSLISELLYFWKMLSNVMIFYVVYKLNIKYVDIRKCLKIIVLFMSISIVLSDILCVSYSAYNFNRTSIPLYKWFVLEKYDFMAGSSKGFFHLTNQIVALLLLYLPIISYECFKSKKLFNYSLVFLIVASMLAIGNRLAIYGTIIELFVISVIYFFLNIKKKINYTYYIFNIILLILIVIIIPKSPLTMRNYYYDAIISNDNISFMNKENQVSKYDAIDNKDELLEKLKEKNVDPNFVINAYPYPYDKKFWIDIAKKDATLTGDARYVELKMVQRVKKINNKKLDSFLGLTYTRVINIFNIEKDFVMQYYSIGYIGCILILGLYFYLFIYICIKILFDLKNKYNEKNIALLLGTSIMFVSSYFSGNILNSISMIIPLSLLLSVLFNEVRVKNNKVNKEKILGFYVSTDNQKCIIDKIINAKNQMFIVNINPLIIMEHKNDKVKKTLFNKESIQIPDGEGIVLVSKLRGGNIKSRIAGIDLMLSTCEEAAKNNKKIYLYGAKQGVAKKSKEELEKMYPKIEIVGFMDGYTDQNLVVKDINKTQAEILFVAIGSPLQEDFIINNRDKLKKVKVLIPVGGSFDVISGNLKRAPYIFQKLKLEWLYRMIKEPTRFKGVIGLIKFLIISIFDKEV